MVTAFFVIRRFKTQAETLPVGWTWVDHQDGSGCLITPSGQHLFSYDLLPYAGYGWIEYRNNFKKKIPWDIFYDFNGEYGIGPFKTYIEKLVNSRKDELCFA